MEEFHAPLLYTFFPTCFTQEIILYKIFFNMCTKIPEIRSVQSVRIITYIRKKGRKPLEATAAANVIKKGGERQESHFIRRA